MRNLWIRIFDQKRTFTFAVKPDETMASTNHVGRFFMFFSTFGADFHEITSFEISFSKRDNFSFCSGVLRDSAL